MKQKKTILHSYSHKNLLHEGHCREQIKLPPLFSEAVRTKNYDLLDQLIAREVLPTGLIYTKLREYTDFEWIEFIISVREKDNEDGIWHDDGSRVLAFSLSLTETPPEGGVLEIRKKGEHQSAKIKTPPYGEMIIFLTGQMGFEHKINRVTKGCRTMIAGWCYPSTIS